MSDTRRWNPLGLLGVVILLWTGFAAVVAEAPLRALAVQSSLPIALGVGLLVYGWYLDSTAFGDHRWTVLRWTVLGVVVFFVIEGFFGQISRQFETSFVLAASSSLAFGAALGAIVGVYSARLQRTNEQLADQREQMEQFANMVGRDLRNPLHVASGQLELARRDHDSDHLDAVAESHDRMEALIKDVLTLAREGGTAPEIEAVSVSAVADRAWQSAETDAATLRVETDATVEAGPGRLQQLLSNLFRNVIEHGADDVTVTVGTLEDGFYVQDDGPGFDDPEKVFETGYTTTASGTGLGLAIVQELADSHDWAVTAANGTDGGARVELRSVEFAD